MSILPEIEDPSLAAGETIHASWRANHTQSGVAVGGKLFLTTQRIVFQPLKLGAVVGTVAEIVGAGSEGVAWSAALADVGGVDEEPGQVALSEMASGGLRARLRLELRSGAKELFIVSELGDVVAAVRSALA